MITFWVLSPFIVLAALGLLFAKKAVHAALCVAAVMIGLACLYAAEGAPFLFTVQIIVYTGAIMMLFLFVLMLIGVDTPDSLKDVIRGQKTVAFIVGICFALLIAITLGQSVSGTVVGVKAANAGGNVQGLASLLFSRYVVAFEFTAALMITAVLGAMVLAHRERLVAPRTQADNAKARMLDYARTGRHPGNPPTPGVFALTNAVDAPALLPDGSPAESSVAAVLVARGQEHHRTADAVEEVVSEVDPHHQLEAKSHEAADDTDPEPSGQTGDDQ